MMGYKCWGHTQTGTECPRQATYIVGGMPACVVHLAQVVKMNLEVAKKLGNPAITTVGLIGATDP